jgi:phosphopantothenoylcysteine decarboxylase/phosphopantothenate--cysteine ligase
LTREAAKFVTPLALETFCEGKVYQGLWSPYAEKSPIHITLADSSDVVLVAPATANVLGKIAGGMCDDLLTCVLLATKAPVIVAPAMNLNMYAHPAVQRNIATLKEWGYRFVGPVEGELACRHYGMGHVAPFHEIVRAVKEVGAATAARR